MSQRPGDQILSEVTHLGSTLTKLATDQVTSLLTELRGPTGDTQLPDRVNLGTLTYSVLELVSKVGELMVQASQYDLVRRGVSHMALRSSNPLSTVSILNGADYIDEFLLENDGNDESGLTWELELVKLDDKNQVAQTLPSPAPPTLDAIAAGERRRLKLTLTGLTEGSNRLHMKIKQGDKVLAGRAVIIKVLPLAKPPTP